jgi:hypothetical protein
LLRTNIIKHQKSCVGCRPIFVKSKALLISASLGQKEIENTPMEMVIRDRGDTESKILSTHEPPTQKRLLKLGN